MSKYKYLLTKKAIAILSRGFYSLIAAEAYSMESPAARLTDPKKEKRHEFSKSY